MSSVVRLAGQTRTTQETSGCEVVRNQMENNIEIEVRQELHEDFNPRIQYLHIIDLGCRVL